MALAGVLLLLGTCTLDVASHIATLTLRVPCGRAQWTWQVDQGRMALAADWQPPYKARVNLLAIPLDRVGMWHREILLSNLPRPVPWLGAVRFHPQPHSQGLAFGLDQVIAALLLVTLLAWRPAVRKWMRRRSSDRCQRCGYDLRYLGPDTTLCPECGRAMHLSPSQHGKSPRPE